MTPKSTRRHFLEVTGPASAWRAWGPVCSGFDAGSVPHRARPKATARPKVAALATVYHYLSHAYHIVGRFVDGFPVYDGHGPHVPPSRSPACSSSKRRQ